MLENVFVDDAGADTHVHTFTLPPAACPTDSLSNREESEQRGLL